MRKNFWRRRFYLEIFHDSYTFSTSIFFYLQEPKTRSCFIHKHFHISLKIGFLDFSSNLKICFFVIKGSFATSKLKIRNVWLQFFKASRLSHLMLVYETRLPSRLPTTFNFHFNFSLLSNRSFSFIFASIPMYLTTFNASSSIAFSEEQNTASCFPISPS